MWIAGLSLVQMVAPHKKGLSNGLMMVSTGIGSVFGPIFGRILLYREELGGLAHGGQWNEIGLRLFTFRPMTVKPGSDSFQLIFWLLTASTFVCGVVVGVWGQRPGRFDQHESRSRQQTVRDLRTLAGEKRYRALVISLCLLGGPLFQASNQYLPYRAADLGLISGSQDQGWVWLSLLKTLMWIPGGAAVGFLGIVGSLGLFVFDRVRPIRQPGFVGCAHSLPFGIGPLSVKLVEVNGFIDTQHADTAQTASCQSTLKSVRNCECRRTGS